jgi:hypothetical protein
MTRLRFAAKKEGLSKEEDMGKDKALDDMKEIAVIVLWVDK